MGEKIQLKMPMIHDSRSSLRSHQERIGATIRQLEGTILSNKRIALQARVSHTAGAETPETVPVTLEKYLEEDSDEEGVVVFTRSCWMGTTTEG